MTHGGIISNFSQEIGNGEKSVNITNSYNRGTINGTVHSGEIIGSISGNDSSLAVNIENCYCNNTSNGIGNVTGAATISGTAEQLKQNSVLGENWKEDTNNINGGYPILNWQ